MSDHFVALASDADAPERPVVELVSEHLADGMMLPFVLFTDDKGQWLGGSHGAVHPDRFRDMVEDLVAD
jgi:hypothetical protein